MESWFGVLHQTGSLRARALILSVKVERNFGLEMAPFCHVNRGGNRTGMVVKMERGKLKINR
jgi:hypothetical protein